MKGYFSIHTKDDGYFYTKTFSGNDLLEVTAMIEKAITNNTGLVFITPDEFPRFLGANIVSSSVITFMEED